MANANDTPPDVNLGGAAVASGTDSSQGGAYVIQAYCQTVLETATLVPPPVGNQPPDPTLTNQLTTDLATAQTHAKYYLDTLNPQLIGLSSAVLGYANQWNAMFSQLLTDAQNVNDPTSRQNLIDGLNLLISKAHAGKLKSKQAATSLSDFGTNDLAADKAAFSSDYDAVNAIYGANSTDEQNLNQLIDACNSAMTKDMIAMGASAVGVIVGGGAVLIGIFAEIPSAGTSSALVVGGFALVAGSAVAGSVAFANWMQSSKQLAQATRALNQAEAICAATQQSLSTIESLSSSCKNAEQASQNLADQWDSLGSDLGETAQQLAKAEASIDSTWLVNLLNAANLDWQQALALAKQLQDGSASLSVQTSTLAA